MSTKTKISSELKAMKGSSTFSMKPFSDLQEETTF